MDVEVIEKRQNPLLNRREIRFKILHPKEPTPNRDSAREKIASENNVKKEQVIIDNLETTFGKSETTGYAKIYPSKEEAMKNEREYHLVRNKLKEGKKKPKPKKEAPPKEGETPPAEGEDEAGKKKGKKGEEKKEGEAPAEKEAEEKKEEEAPPEDKTGASETPPSSDDKSSKNKEE